jgi:hypothetical protein
MLKNILMLTMILKIKNLKKENHDNHILIAKTIKTN